MRRLFTIFPPLSILGIASFGQIVLNILLSIIWIPGIIHANTIISRYHQAEKDRLLQRELLLLQAQQLGLRPPS